MRHGTYELHSGFEVTKKVISSLTEEQKSEFVMFVDENEFFAREELPKDKYLDLLKAIVRDDSVVYTPLLQNYKISNLSLVTGLKENVEFGNQSDVSGDHLNPLHWAVYKNNLKATKAIVENQIFNILIAGKVPQSTGLANESEMSIHEDHIHENGNSSVAGKKSTRHHDPKTCSEAKFGAAPRSLILFWPIDKENIEMFQYLWGLEGINWGLKNLKFHLAMMWIKENPRLLEIFLYSPAFSRAVKSVSFEDAMDFLENFVVKNDRIPEDMKIELLEKDSMLVYDFVGELMSLEGKLFFWLSNLDIPHLKELHKKLTPEDFARIKSSYKAMQKIEELRNEVNNMEDSELQQDIEELLEDLEENQN